VREAPVAPLVPQRPAAAEPNESEALPDTVLALEPPVGVAGYAEPSSRIVDWDLCRRPVWMPEDE